MVDDAPRVLRSDGVWCSHRCPTCRISVHPACPICATLLPNDAPAEHWLEVTVDERWVAAYRLVPEAGRHVVGELRVFPNDPGRSPDRPGRWSADRLGTEASVPSGGLTARLLRRIKVAEHVGRVMPGILDNVRRKSPHTPVDELLSKMGFGKATPGARQPRTDVFMATLASEYIDLLDAGVRSPVRELAERYGRSEVSVRGLVHDCRNKGFLTRPPGAGQAGGELTDKAVRALRSAEGGADDTRADGRGQPKASKGAKGKKGAG